MSKSLMQSHSGRTRLKSKRYLDRSIGPRQRAEVLKEKKEWALGGIREWNAQAAEITALHRASKEEAKQYLSRMRSRSYIRCCFDDGVCLALGGLPCACQILLAL
jgi:hypothetical protein